MTVHRRATWLAAMRMVPLAAIGVVTALGCVSVALVAGTPERLSSWIVLTGVVLAGVAASAVDDPTESVAASTPVARRRRWTVRASVASVAASAGIAVVAATGVVVLSIHGVAVVDVLDRIGPATAAVRLAAYLALGCAVAAASGRYRGPGLALRSAGPAVVGFHVVVEATGTSWPHWLLGAEAGTTGWWCVVLGLAIVAFLLEASDPARRLHWRRP